MATTRFRLPAPGLVYLDDKPLDDPSNLAIASIRVRLRPTRSMVTCEFAEGLAEQVGQFVGSSTIDRAHKG